jgi:hypothetical protein
MGWEIVVMVLFFVIFAALIAFFLALIMRSGWFNRRTSEADRSDLKSREDEPPR